MADMSGVIAPKSDQINADDLVAGDMTITITDVHIRAGEQQPVSVSFAGSTKVWRPCKTTGRVLVHGWGSDTSNFIGKSLTLFRDPNVMWSGVKVGGIRIRAMSHIDHDFTIALSESKQKRVLTTIKRLNPPPPPPPRQIDTAPPIPGNTVTQDEAREYARNGTAAFKAWWDANPDKRADAKSIKDTLKQLCADADAALASDPFGLPPTNDDGNTRSDQE